MPRTSILFLSFLLLLVCPPAVSALDIETCWTDFKTNCMSIDGRIIDWQNVQQSHSEGQGLTMLVATLLNDQKTFDLVFTWSENNLGHGIRAWKWGKDKDAWHIIDSNNATDGDILHAWALLLAGEKWKDQHYTDAGLNILSQIRTDLITENGLIIPGKKGFKTKQGYIINPSYYIFPALKDFARFDPANKNVWEKTYAKGLELIKDSTQKNSGLIPDWVRCAPNEKYVKNSDTELFSYDAIRIPTYLGMAGEMQMLEIFRPLLIKTAQQRYLPDALGLNGKDSSKTEALGGAYAILAKCADQLKMNNESSILWQLAEKKQLSEKGNYYGSILYILSLLH